jgi:peptidoglycan hydrolase CwlO-like protein
MSKRALLIGINYFNTPSSQLYGCIFDIIQMKSLLIDVYGFEEKDIIMLRDDDPSNMPTKQRILNEYTTLIAERPSYAFLHYSGHVTSIKDSNADEKDGMDECIVPCDYQSAGIITDDDINKILKGIQSNGIALFDCCRSGTIIDFPYEGINTKATPVSPQSALYCFSGCQDSQLASETFAVSSGLPQGAATAAMISVLRRQKYYPSIATLYSELIKEIKGNGFEQVPHITGNVEITSGNAFPFKSPIQAQPQENVSQYTSQINTLNAQLTESTAQLNASKASVSSLQAQLNTSNSQLNMTKSMLTQTQNQLNASNANVSSLQAQLTTTRSTLSQTQNQLNASKATSTALQAQLNTTKSSLTQAQSQLNTMLTRVSTVNSENASLRSQVAQLQKLLSAKK